MSDLSTRSNSPISPANKEGKMPIFYAGSTINKEKNLYPHSIVWTPIPLLTWLFPFIGHMGICMSNGVIRDFAGPYHVSEDHMAFGNPTKYWQLNIEDIPSENPKDLWDRCVYEASEVYKGRMHNLFCDNCHSHVAMALSDMKYGSKSWNMVNTWFRFMFKSKYVSFAGFLKSWIPSILIFILILTLVIVFVVKNH